jgi:Rap1a immunity proteins
MMVRLGRLISSPGRRPPELIAHKELASAAAGEGITPLELMLKRMRYYHSLAEREMRKGEEADRHIIDAALKAANESAKDAAPFLHPRLSAIEHSGTPMICPSASSPVLVLTGSARSVHSAVAAIGQTDKGIYPPNLNWGQRVRVVIQYIDSRPERPHENFFDLAAEALRAAWPCPAR